MVISNNKAKIFFEKHVIPSFSEWKGSEGDERIAMNLANNLNSIIDYYWHAFSTTDPAKTLGKGSLKEFRSELAKSNINIALVRDIADAHKHFKLNRTDRSFTSVEQTSIKI